MIGLLQRVTEASVSIGGERVAAIARGVLVLVAVEPGDGPAQAARLAERLVRYRVFPDAAGRMNLSVQDVGGALLLVPQFTLAADTSRGNRPSFTRAADPALGQALFARLCADVAASGVPCASGRFGADMQVALINDGPVTFWLHAGAPR